MVALNLFKLKKRIPRGSSIQFRIAIRLLVDVRLITMVEWDTYFVVGDYGCACGITLRL